MAVYFYYVAAHSAVKLPLGYCALVRVLVAKWVYVAFAG